MFNSDNKKYIQPSNLLSSPEDIRKAIQELSTYTILWLDTEIADWKTQNPRLSLIQALASLNDITGNSTFILDVLKYPDLVNEFVQQIIRNPDIEKVFHNANFDLKYLGGEDRAVNVTCTYRIAQKITKKRLGVTNLKLKTLAVELCNFSPDEIEHEQTSDWGKRPLSYTQLKYAKMDTVYLACVHKYLLELMGNNAKIDPSWGFSAVTPDLIEEYLPVLVKIDELSYPPLNINELRLAVECPRLFYLVNHFGGESKFIQKDDLVKLGERLEVLSEQFINQAKQEYFSQLLFEQTAVKVDKDTVVQKMQQEFYRTFYNYLKQPTQETAPTLLQLWQILTQVIQRWGEIFVANRNYYSPEEIIDRTFVTQNLKVEHTFILSSDRQQLIQGKLNNLFYNRENCHLLFIEYKSPRLVESSTKFTVALSSYLLKQNLQLDIESVTYWLLPELQEFTYSWQEIEQTITQIITNNILQIHQWLAWNTPASNPPPATRYTELCQICPQQEKCQTYFSSSPSPPGEEGKEKTYPSRDKDTKEKIVFPPPEPISHSPTDEGIGRSLVSVLDTFGINVDYLGSIVAPAFIRVKLRPKMGVDVSKITKQSDNLQVQLGFEFAPLIQPQPGYVSVDIPRRERQVAKFEQYLSRDALDTSTEFKIAIGVNLERQLIEADLADSNTCHFLVGGGTGSGKSIFLRSLLLSLLVRHSSKFLRVVLVDPKRVTFPEFENIPWLYTPIVKEEDDAIALMTNLVEEMERRYQILEKGRCEDIKTYNQKLNSDPEKSLPRIVCIFDEYADFMAEKATRDSLEQNIKRLGAKARAAGIHLIIATQRPEAKVVTPLIRSNLPGRVALKTNSPADSIMILGEKQTGAAQLLGKGDLLYPMGGRLERLQALLAENFQIISQ